MESDSIESLERMLKVKNIIKGLYDTMVYMETAEQDKMIPITVLCPFEAALEQACLLLEEAEAGMSRYNSSGGCFSSETEESGT